MEEPKAQTPSDLATVPSPDPRLSALPGAGWSDLRWLALLLLLTVGVRAWQMTHTEVTSRDSVGYIRIAWRLGHEDWRDVIPSVPQHPGYSVSILALSGPLRLLVPDDPALAMQLAAQFASALASVLLLFPVYYLGKDLFDRRVGFWVALLLQVLPASGKLMADGLSEPLFLSLAVSGIFCASRGLNRGSARWFVGAGLFGSLAYLTRVEGTLVVAATGLVLLVFQCVRGWRLPWGQWLRCGVALTVPAILVALPFMVVIRGFTVKPVKHHMVQQTNPQWAPPGEEALAPSTSATATTLWATWLVSPNLTAADRNLWAIQALADNYVKATFYVLWVPALVGLVVFRDRFRKVRGAWVVFVVVGVLLALLYRVAQVMGYMSERHMQLIVVMSLYWAVAAIGWLAGRWADLVPRLHGRAVLVASVVLIAVTVAPLQRTLRTLHADRAGFRQAGQWLARHAEPGDELVDPYAWAGYYAGRVFVEGQTDLPAAQPAVTYVVLEEGPSKHIHLWWLIPQARELADKGEAVQRFPVKRGKERAEVVIYRVARS